MMVIYCFHLVNGDIERTTKLLGILHLIYRHKGISQLFQFRCRL